MGMDRGNIAKSVYLQFGAVGGSEVAAETAKFNAESKKAEASAKSLAKEGGGAADFLREKFDGLKTSIAGMVGIAGAKALFNFSAEGARLLDLQSNVDRLGVSISDLSGIAGGTFSEEMLGNAALLADKLGRSLGLTAEQTQGLTRDAIRLSSSFGVDLNDSVRKLFLSLTGETRGLKETFGLIVDGQAVIETYALSMGKTSDKLTEFEKRTAVANAIQEKLNGQLANAPLNTYQDRLGSLLVKVDDFTASLKRAAAEMLLNPLTEALTGQYESKNVSSGNQAADRLAQARNRAQSLRDQLASGDFETSGPFDTTRVDDRIAAEKELRETETAIVGLISATVAESKRLRDVQQESAVIAEGERINEAQRLENAKARIQAEKDRAEAGAKAAQAAEAERAKLAEIAEARRQEAVLGRTLPKGTLELLLNPYKEITAARERGNAALIEAMRAEGAELDARVERSAKRQTEIEARRGSLLGEARTAGSAQASRFAGPLGSVFGEVQGPEAYGDIPRFNQAIKDGGLLPGEAERAQTEAFRDSINSNIITPLEIAADATSQLAAGFSDAAAAAIIDGKGFEKGLQTVFKTLAKLALSKAIFEQAEALAALAWGNIPGFVAHEKASGAFLLVAGAAALGTKAAGGSFGADSEREDRRERQSSGARGVRNVNNNVGSGSGSGQTVINYYVAYNGFTADQRGHEELVRMINANGWRPGAPKIDQRAMGAA